MSTQHAAPVPRAAKVERPPRPYENEKVAAVSRSLPRRDRGRDVPDRRVPARGEGAHSGSRRVRGHRTSSRLAARRTGLGEGRARADRVYVELDKLFEPVNAPSGRGYREMGSQIIR